MSNVDQIVASTEAFLQSRPTREPDFRAESLALTHLAEALATEPDRVLHALCEQVIAICGAESAGVSLLNNRDSEDFLWPAIAGQWADYVGGGMPRSASPCGVVLKQDRSLLFHDVEQQFPAVSAAVPRIGEILLAPFRVEGHPIGTVWAIVHSDAKRFDREDQRLLENLAQFAGATYKVIDAVKATRDARAQLALLNNELAHRLKNMLTMVMALASQTLKGVTEKEAVDAFQSRLQALATAHDLLIDQTWAAAPMQVIVERAIGNFAEADRLDFEGPELTLGSKAALSLTLILHELATNALKYGALSVPEGRVSFRWSIVGGEQQTLQASWREKLGPPVQAPSRKGFGSRLIGMGLIGAGGVQLTYPVDGVRADFEAPLHLAKDESGQETAGA